MTIAAINADLPALQGVSPDTATRDLQILIAEDLVESQAAIELRRTVEQIAPLDASVLITGETGTGKELVARAIHESSPRSGEPFLAVNCGAISENLLESELFGHERGAFTGAAAAHRGLFEEAGRGVLLLDEIGEMSPRLQVALLRVLEAGEIRPVGNARSRKIACRVIAATNADLEALAESGAFREDLLYRLKRLEIRTKPLRERREDIVPLAEYFLAEGRSDGGRPRLSADLQAELKRQAWPGNVRELRNVIEKLRLMNSDRLEYGLAEFEANQNAPVAGFASALLADEHVQSAGKGCSRRGRIELIRDMFRRHRKLTRKEIIQALGVAQGTATAYMRMLCQEGFIKKVTPSGAPHTHYFEIAPRS